MDHFSYRERTLFCENVPVRQLAETYGTPLYVYSTATLLHHLTQLQKAFAAVEPLICYSLKTNANLHICRLLAQHGRTLPGAQGRGHWRQDCLRRSRQNG